MASAPILNSKVSPQKNVSACSKSMLIITPTLPVFRGLELI
jgi:hypothetical protein